MYTSKKTSQTPARRLPFPTMLQLRRLAPLLPSLSVRTMATIKPAARVESGSHDHETKGARMVKRNIKGSSFKLNLLAKQISGKPVKDALTQMKFSKKRRSETVAKAITTACNMADLFHGLSQEELYIAEAITGRGSYSKRPHYRARGKFDFIRKTQSHLTIVVREDNRDLSTTRRGKNPRRNKNRRRPGEQ